MSAAQGLTDKQLMLLSDIAYLDHEWWPHKVPDLRDVGPEYDPKSVKPNRADTLGEFLDAFDDARLEEMENSNNPDDVKQAAIIREMKEDPELCALKIVDRNSDVFAITYEDSSGNMIVAFRGTGTAEEWYDNAVGLAGTDTPSQIDALEYIESLDGEHITVTGHSKGGNKAQYVSILSDKVDRCVSMDGQGFSGEFYDKYYAEVAKKADRIKNYFVDGDYVNILLIPVPNAEQIAVESTSDVTSADFHHSSSFFQYYWDDEGNIRLGKIDSEGNVRDYLVFGTREEAMQFAHEFTCFILNVMPENERVDVGVFIGTLLAIGRRGGYPYKDGYYTNIKDFLQSDSEMFGKVLAYIIKYVDTYGLTADEVTSLLQWLGLDQYLDEVCAILVASPLARDLTGGIALSAGSLLLLLMANLKDGKRDHIINFLIGLTGFEDVWKETEDAYADIPEFDKNTANQHGTLKTGKVRDFSQQTYDKLMNAINGVDRSTMGPISGWYSYSGEEWYDDLMIDNMIRGISAYFNRIGEINQQSRTNIDNVFNNVYDIDTTNAEKLHTVTEQLSEVAVDVRKIAARVR